MVDDEDHCGLVVDVDVEVVHPDEKDGAPPQVGALHTDHSLLMAGDVPVDVVHPDEKDGTLPQDLDVPVDPVPHHYIK